MKNILKWSGIIIGGAAFFLVLLSVLLYFFLPLNTIKDLVTAKLSESLHRDVKIKKVSFNIFTGIKLNGLTISNANGYAQTPFVSADTIELKYAFWPIFRGKFIVPEINLVKPQILIEKSRRGVYNFADLSGVKEKTKASPKPSGKKAPAVDLIINSFTITNGRLTYYDYAADSKSELNNLNLKITGLTLAMVKPVDIRASANGMYNGKNVPISLALAIKIDLSGDNLKISPLSFSIAGDTLKAEVSADNLKRSPILAVSLSGQALALDPFLALFSGGAPSPKEKNKAPVHGALTQSLKSSFASIPANVSALLSLDFKDITLKALKIDALQISAALRGRQLSFDLKNLSAYKGKLAAKGDFNPPALSYNLRQLELKGFDAAPFTNSVIDSFLPDLLDMKNKAEGKLDVYLAAKGAGVEMPEVFANLTSSGKLLLSDGRLKKLKSLESIGEQYNVSVLKHDLLVHGLRVDFSLANRKLDVKNLSLQDTDLQAAFTGGLDFGKMEYMAGNRLTLKFSPAATGTLPKELSIFKDEKGFTSVDFELTGALSKPIPSPRFEKALEVGVGRIKAKIEVQKIEIETKASKKLEEEKQILQEDAKKKVKEIFKF